MPGFPDYQKYAQWFGAPIFSGQGLVLGAGAHTDGPGPAGNWSSVVLYIKPTGGGVTATVRQTSSGVPASLFSDTVIRAGSGTTVVESVVLQGDTVELILQGGTAGEQVDYALVPSNTSSNVETVSGASLPTGFITPFAGATVPAGFLLCDGSAVSRASYAGLFSIIGTAYGAGDGSTTFNLPDLRGRTIVGVGSHADVSAIGETEGLAVASRTPKHGTSSTLAVTAGTLAAGIGSLAANIGSLAANIGSLAVGSGSLALSDPGHGHDRDLSPGGGATNPAFATADTNGTPVRETAGSNHRLYTALTGMSLVGAPSLAGSPGLSGAPGLSGSPALSGAPALTGGIGAGAGRPADTPAYIALSYLIAT